MPNSKKGFFTISAEKLKQGAPQIKWPEKTTINLKTTLYCKRGKMGTWAWGVEISPPGPNVGAKIAPVEPVWTKNG